MLNWWLGRSAEENYGQDEYHEQDAPETPAPVFAARALKSAIFGTPAFVTDDTIYKIEQDEGMQDAGKHAGKDITASQSGNISPTKPPGILLTPGTAAMRRKTVSFGNEVVDKEMNPEEGGGTLQNQWSSKRRTSRKTSLTKQLEEARESKSSTTANSKTSNESNPQINVETRRSNAAPEKIRSAPSRGYKSEKSNQELLQEMATGVGHNADVTVDLSEPRSQSGRYWKEQFQTYHDEAKAELQNLLKYKHMARTYAKARDTDALDLHEKLKEEQRKVIRMEDKISQLSARIATAGFEGLDDESPELIKELARQTALSLQYKSQVEEFRAALEENGGSPLKRNSQDGRILTLPGTEHTFLETTRDLKKAREQLREMTSLRNELDDVRQTLSTAEKTSQKLQDENTNLTQELLHANLRLEKHVDKCERRRQSSEEQRQRKEEALRTLQMDYDTLKENAKAQRRDAEHQLKKRHDQVVELKKEIASLRAANSTVQDFQQALQKKSQDHDKIVRDLQTEIASLRAKVREREGIAGSKTDSMPPPLQRVAIYGDASHAREKHIAVSNQLISRPLKTVASARQLRSDTPAGSPLSRSAHPALSEIVNQATVDSVPPRTHGPVQYTPLARRFSDLSLHSPRPKVPSEEPSTSREIHERYCKPKPSPMPSMFNIPSSPPKPVMMRSHDSDELARKGSSNHLQSRRQGNANSSRLSAVEGSRMRGNLPPERAAAARARLEQKNAEKKKAKSGGDKENIQV
ncbi:hypothetical protein LSUB1_G001282 [Lachnellula subtilissima]|uniref:Spindle pole body-associated protein cut12 domain-containing protein n=1 Tax=Lachnellula subtilissima TaxID=602034 RepID=A0A8H8RW12_9HELO|nr:hypothetical protein LSUB1_G001282 [Lachnellula subtilissima]